MKKILSFIALSLFLVSCSDFIDNRKLKKIKKCADPKALQNDIWGLDKNLNIRVGNLSPELRKRLDPLNMFEDDLLIGFDEITLKTKFKDEGYEKIWTSCEKELSLTPLKFKEKYLK